MSHLGGVLGHIAEGEFLGHFGGGAGIGLWECRWVVAKCCWCSGWRISGRWYGTTVNAGQTIRRWTLLERRGRTPNHQSRVARDWLVCSLRIHFPRYAVSKPAERPAVLLLTTRPLTRAGIRSAFQHCFGNLNAPPLSPHSLFAEKGSCVGSCLSCPVASCSSEISPTHYSTLSPAYTVPVSSCLSAAASTQRASSCRVHCHACSPRRPITG